MNDWRRDPERGAALFVVVLWLPILLLVTALVVDVGALWVARVQGQAAVDLAVLAAVQSVDWEALEEGTIQLVEEEAEAAARSYLTDNARALGGARPDEVEVWVINARPEAPKTHPLTGEELRYPVVSLRCRWPGPKSVFGSWVGATERWVEADAALRPRRDG